jgi:hypothetical protein
MAASGLERDHCSIPSAVETFIQPPISHKLILGGVAAGAGLLGILALVLWLLH